MNDPGWFGNLGSGDLALGSQDSASFPGSELCIRPSRGSLALVPQCQQAFPIYVLSCLSDQCGYIVLSQAGLKLCPIKDRHFLCEWGCCSHLAHGPLAFPSSSWQYVEGRSVGTREGERGLGLQWLWAKELKRRHCWKIHYSPLML